MILGTTGIAGLTAKLFVDRGSGYNLEEYVVELKNAGIHVHGEIAENNHMKYIYFTAPDGVVIELTEYKVSNNIKPVLSLFNFYNKNVNNLKVNLFKILLGMMK